jgi:hypothetical protein
LAANAHERHGPRIGRILCALHKVIPACSRPSHARLIRLYSRVRSQDQDVLTRGFDLQVHKQSLNLLLWPPNNTPTTTSHSWIEAPEMASEACPVFPENAGISYLNEGAANIVYRISIRYPTPQPSQLEEYGDNTPPPTEIEVLEDKKQVDLNIFDSK